MPEPLSSTSIPPLLEEEFLPPMGRWATTGAWMLVGILVGSVGLAMVTEYNVTVQAPASVRPAEELSVVQAVTGGTVRRVLVRENQTVQQGDVIAEFGVPDRDQLQKLQMRRQRLQQYIYQYQEQLTQIDDQLHTLYREITNQAGVMAASATDQPMPWLAAEADVDLALQQLTTAAPAEAKRLADHRDRLQQQRLGMVNQIQNDQTALQSIDSELNQYVIQAPTAGTVFKLTLHNAGQTVLPGDIVAQIVPQKALLVVKARVAVQDISLIKVGQPAQLRVSAYPYPDYGTLEGTVKAIAPDVVSVRTANPSEMAAYYEVMIQPSTPYLQRRDRQYPIQPGMEVRADIISRKETVLQAFLRRLRLWSDL